jgi:hypothetical protein
MAITPLSTSGAYARFFVLTDGVNSDAGSTQSWTPFINYDGNIATARNSGYLTSASITTNTPNIMTSYIDGSGMYISPNGAEAFRGANIGSTSNVSISRWVIGGNEAGNTTWDPRFRVGEILVFSNALPSNVRYQIEGYLAAKWGLNANLPVAHPFKTLRPFSRPFIPTDISGCAVWLDSMDPSGTGITPSSGTAITTWIDKSGSGRHGTNAGTGTSTMGTTSNTGRPTVVMGGSNYFRLSNASTLSVTSASYFVQAFATGSNRTLLSFWNNERILGPTYYWDNATNTSLSPYAWSNTNAVLSIVENSASNCTVHFNGNALTGPAYKAAAANSNVILGAHWSLDNWWLGNIQEVILYDGALTPGQRQQVETYLMNKWGTRGATPSNHYARLAPALGVAFNPRLLSNCGMWLDAADATSLTMSGTNVVRWNDKSGNTRHAVSTGSPQMGTTTTGRPAVVLSGANYFDVSGASTLSGGSSTVFVQASATTNERNLYNLWDNARSLTFQLYYNGADNLFFTSNTLFLNSNAMCCIVEDVTAALSSAFFNGRADNTLATGSRTPNSSFVLGGNSGGTNAWIGNIQEVIYYNRALPRTERQLVEGYLAGKWGLKPTLPNGHPYKTSTP